MANPKFSTIPYLRGKYKEIADDPKSTIAEKFKALKAISDLRVKSTNHKHSKKNLRNQKEKAPQVTEKPVVIGKVDTNLLGTVQE